MHAQWHYLFFMHLHFKKMHVSTSLRENNSIVES